MARSSSIKYSLRPQTLDYLIDQEWKIKYLETEITLKTEEVMKLRIQLKDLHEKVEALKKMIREDRQQRMEKLKLFPEATLEVKQIIFEKIMKD